MTNIMHLYVCLCSAQGDVVNRTTTHTNSLLILNSSNIIFLDGSWSTVTYTQIECFLFTIIRLIGTAIITISQLNDRHIERKNNDYQLSIKSSEDDYMKMALTKVRKSNVTHNEDLLRRQGTWMWNMK